MTLPVPRPDPQTILPRATRTVAEMYLQQTGTQTGEDRLYVLKSGEGIGKLLRRASYGATDVAAAVEAVSGELVIFCTGRDLPAACKIADLRAPSPSRGPVCQINNGVCSNYGVYAFR